MFFDLRLLLKMLFDCINPLFTLHSVFEQYYPRDIIGQTHVSLYLAGSLGAGFDDVSCDKLVTKFNKV